MQSLTRRGIGLLVAGGAVFLAGLVADVRDLLRLGVLAVALPVAAMVLVARNRYRVSCERSLEPSRVPAGEQSRVTLRLRNLARIPTTTLLAEDTLPASLGGRPRFTLDRVEGEGQRAATYAISSPVRGRFAIGPLSMRVSDPFGLCEVTRAFATVTTLVVTPPVVPLPAIRLAGEWTGGGDARSAAVSSVGEDDVATRPYRHGDDLRRVHWRSTARIGELMVRREEQPWQNRCALVFDSRSAGHRGEGLHTSFEAAVAALASVGAHLAQRGWALRVVAADGREPVVAAAAVAEDVLLDALADIGPSRSPSLAAGVARVTGAGGHEGLTVAICGELDAEQTGALARARGSGTGLALLLDTSGWVTGDPASPRYAKAVEAARAAVASSADRLAVAGWRVAVLRRDADLASAWRSLGVGELAAATRGGDVGAMSR